MALCGLTERAPGVGNVGEQFQRAPKWTYRAAATYTQPLSDTLSLEMNGALSGVGPTRFCGESAVFGPCPARDAYHLVDASISLVWPRYRISLFARNLFDTTYPTDFLAKSALAQFGATSAGSVYGDPRYWGVRACGEEMASVFEPFRAYGRAIMYRLAWFMPLCHQMRKLRSTAAPAVPAEYTRELKRTTK